MNSSINENWRKCPQCGSPLLVNPQTGKTEPCANCASQKSTGGLFGGTFAIVLGVVVVAILVIYGISLLLG
jgi:uncharacterized protein (DUF983 family)